MDRYPITAAIIAALICLSALMVGFAPAQTQIQLTKLSESDLKSVTIRFERTGCYGNCPAYKLTIHGDGQMEYVGNRDVKQIGSAQGKIEPTDLKALLSEFEKARFLGLGQFAEQGCTCTICTDMPTVNTELEVQGTAHKVVHYYGCRCAPKALWDLEDAIDKIARTERWTGDVSKQGPFGTTCFNPKQSF